MRRFMDPPLPRHLQDQNPAWLQDAAGFPQHDLRLTQVFQDGDRDNGIGELGGHRERGIQVGNDVGVDRVQTLAPIDPNVAINVLFEERAIGGFPAAEIAEDAFVVGDSVGEDAMAVLVDEPVVCLAIRMRERHARGHCAPFYVRASVPRVVPV